MGPRCLPLYMYLRLSIMLANICRGRHNQTTFTDAVFWLAPKMV